MTIIRRAPRQAPPAGPSGVFIAIFTILALCAVAFGVAWGVTQVLGSVFDRPGGFQVPAYLILILGVVALVPLLLVAVRLLPWLMNWYYLLPAIFFLLAFTVYPIVLTVGYAFTNYSGINSGESDTSTRLEVTKLSSTQLQIVGGVNPQTEFRCETATCAGIPIGLPDPQDASKKARANTIVGIEGSVVTLKNPLPDFFNPALVNRVNPIEFIGVANFTDIFAKAGAQLLPVLVWTVIFAVSTTLINVVAGLVLGILLNNKRLKFRNAYRTLLFLPWAIPAVISIQIWKDGLMATNTGALNRLFGLFGGLPIPWRDDELWAKVAILLVNLWLGFPYMMTATLSALSAIPEDLYEAAEVDGATKWQQVTGITLPMLQTSFVPIALSTFAFNFNNFGLIFLLTEGGPKLEGRLATAQSTDILISWGYNTAFTAAGNAAYGPASAIAIIVAVLTISISVVNFRAAGVFKEAQR